MEKNLRIALSQMLLVKDAPVGAGSLMLDGAPALFDSAVAERLRAVGATLLRAPCGEFAIDLCGETACAGEGADLLFGGDADATVSLDVNGDVRRIAAQNGLFCIKPTYGSISRYGVVSVAPSGETVAITGASVADCRAVLSLLACHDERDGTSLPESLCARVREQTAPPRRIIIPTEMLCGVDQVIEERIGDAARALRAAGAEVVCASVPMLTGVRAAWNTVLCAEVCKSTARYDGVRYGHRTEIYRDLDELYSRSRAEGFGELVKCAILYGSDVLSPEKYEAVYQKALRLRTLVKKELSRLLSEYDAILMPACSVGRYTKAWMAAHDFAAFEENRYTAPASLTGLPTVVAGGVQLVGDALCEGMLLSAAEIIAGGGAQ